MIDNARYVERTGRETVGPSPIDLRGDWRISDKSEDRVRIDRPVDLVRYGFWVSPDDIVSTPTWGEEGLQEYHKALEYKEEVRAGKITSDSWGFIPTTGILIDYELTS